jgi:hypothetical protein
MEEHNTAEGIAQLEQVVAIGRDVCSGCGSEDRWMRRVKLETEAELFATPSPHAHGPF